MSNILFRALSTEALEVVYDAMFERSYQSGDSIIRQRMPLCLHACGPLQPYLALAPAAMFYDTCRHMPNFW